MDPATTAPALAALRTRLMCYQQGSDPSKPVSHSNPCVGMFVLRTRVTQERTKMARYKKYENQPLPVLPSRDDGRLTVDELVRAVLLDTPEEGRKALVRGDPAWTLRTFLDAVAHFFRQSYGYEPPVGAASDFLLLQKDGVDINYLDETLGSWFQSGCLVGVTEKPLLSKPTTTALAAPAYFPFQPQPLYQYPQNPQNNPFLHQKPQSVQTQSYPAQQPVAKPPAPQMPLYQYYQPPATQPTPPPPPPSLPKPTTRWADSPAPAPKKDSAPSLEEALVESIKACAGPEGWAFAATVGHKFKSSTGQNLHVISNTAVSAGWVERRGSQKTIELRVVRAPGSKPTASKPEAVVSKPVAKPTRIPIPAQASQKPEQQKSLDASFADLLEVLTDRPEKEPEWLPITKVAERLFHRTGGDLSKILPGAIETGVIECDAERARLRVRPGF